MAGNFAEEGMQNFMLWHSAFSLSSQFIYCSFVPECWQFDIWQNK